MITLLLLRATSAVVGEALMPRYAATAADIRCHAG